MQRRGRRHLHPADCSAEIDQGRVGCAENNAARCLRPAFPGMRAIRGGQYMGALFPRYLSEIRAGEDPGDESALRPTPLFPVLLHIPDISRAARAGHWLGDGAIFSKLLV